MSAAESAHAALMDGVYRHQRHVYDLTRKYYLLGRDRLVKGLDVPPGGTVLELGCGTGRNLIQAARRYPDARFFGIDISRAMLETAAANLAKERIAGRTKLAHGDATSFEATDLFGVEKFDRVFISYALSMIPGWEKTIPAALAALSPGGSLHIVDFGQQESLPHWFRSGLRAWLAKFHVEPRDSMREVLESECQRVGASLSFETLYRGYAVRVVFTLPSAA
jgi:S-adenosylmethionine-diacylgycerolhomoserine-N-methlytransferase